MFAVASLLLVLNHYSVFFNISGVFFYYCVLRSPLSPSQSLFSEFVHNITMCAECHRSENSMEYHHIPFTPKYAYQLGCVGLDHMLINLKRAGLTRLNILKNPIDAPSLGTINRLVELDLIKALRAIRGCRLQLGDLDDLGDITFEMLNSKKLTELLTENVHPKLFPKWM